MQSDRQNKISINNIALIKSIIRLLATDLKKIYFNKYIYFIIAVYVGSFGFSVFIMNDINISLLGALGVDHASMLDSMIKMLNLNTLYDQTTGYHSSYYGWTYFAISFIFLAPIKLIAWALGINSYLPIYIGLKVLHLLYGLLAGISFYYLLGKFTTNIYALVGVLIMALCSPITIYHYRFHPETVGVFFLNLACIYLINLARRNKLIKKDLFCNYLMILLFLVLSTLAKPTFILITAPIYLCLLSVYIRNLGKPIFSYLKSNDFKKFFAKSIGWSLVIFFIINPFFFIKLKEAIWRQLDNVHAHAVAPKILWHESIAAWISTIASDPFITFSILATVIVVVCLWLNKKMERFLRNNLLFVQFAVLGYILFVILSFKLSSTSIYLIPIWPLLAINSIVLISYIAKRLPLPSGANATLSLMIIAIMSFGNFKANLTGIEDFANYKEGVQYKIFAYIKNNIPNGSSIMHDHYVSIPDGKDIKSYHYWQNSIDTLRDIETNYIIFNPELKFNNHYQEATLILKEHVKNHSYKKMQTIECIEIWERIKS